MIRQVLDEKYASYCDILLTKLIQDESKYDDSINKSYTVKNYFKNIIKQKDHILLCYEENNYVVGYIYLKPIKCDNKTGYLVDGLYVEEEYRNKGIAKKLIIESLNRLSKINVEFIDINVLYDNVVAKKLYK